MAHEKAAWGDARSAGKLSSPVSTSVEGNCMVIADAALNLDEITAPDHDVVSPASIQYKVASTKQDRADAFRLVYQSYLRSGLGEPNPHHMRVTPYHLLPTTEVFLATCRGEAIFSMTLVLDGALGLPMEVVYGEEVASRRKQGLFLAEVSCLADRRKNFRGFLPIFFGVSRLMAQYAWSRGVHELLVAVHPKHAKFYRRYMAFSPFGELRAYPTVRNNPAVALALNFDHINRNRPKSFGTFFGQWLPEERLIPQPITPTECEYFGSMVDPTFSIAPIPDMDYSTFDIRSEFEMLAGAGA